MNWQPDELPVQLGDLVKMNKMGERGEVVEISYHPAIGSTPKFVYTVSVDFPPIKAGFESVRVIFSGPDINRLTVVRESMDRKGKIKHVQGEK